MNKDIAFRLREYALEVGQIYSNPDRERNYSKETFKINEILPLSEYTAVVIYLKDGGKHAMAFFYYTMNGRWNYFFPSDSHINGMEKLKDILWSVEKYNFSKNFKE